MLIIVKNRNFHSLAQLLFNIEALGGLYVLKINAAEGWFECGDDIDQPVGITLIHLDIKNIDTGEFFEQYCLAFHDRFRG